MNQKINYPHTRTGQCVDILHGKRIADEYRWLESDTSERKLWIQAQNTFTNEFFAAVPEREGAAKRLEELVRYEKTTSVCATTSAIFYEKIKPEEKQYSLYMRAWPKGSEELLIDANKLSEDGSVSIANFSATKDGTLLAYALNKEGSDWEHWFVIDVKTGKMLDEIPRLAYTSPSWLPDNSGFFYSRSKHDSPDQLQKVGMKLYFHKLGNDWRSDELVYGKGLPETHLPYVSEISEDGRHLIIGVWKSYDSNELLYMDRQAKTPIESITGDTEAIFYPLIKDNVLYIMTNLNAPKFRLCNVTLEKSTKLEGWETLVEEDEHVLSSFNVIGGELYIKKTIDVIDHVFRHALSGDRIGELELPALGTASVPYGEDKVDAVFLTFESFFYPSTTYNIDLKEKKLSIFSTSTHSFDPEEYVAEQLWFRSKDDTEVPMFIVRPKNLKTDGTNPTILYGYGGFNEGLTPYFSASRMFWLENGGVLVYANLRGGNEFGEEWHNAGMLNKKQNVFDDFISAGEALIGIRPIRQSGEQEYKSRAYTAKRHLGILGASNGGLLTGAAIVQRPDLWSAAISDVPLLDMTRFHLTEGGKHWVCEYGDPDDQAHLESLLNYSPYHNVKEGTKYPAVLLSTSLGDDRGVDPMHAMKMAARLQRSSTSNKPVLLRINEKTGHGHSKPLDMEIKELTEEYLFFLHFLR